MEARFLRELELLPVARLYGIDAAAPPAPALRGEGPIHVVVASRAPQEGLVLVCAGPGNETQGGPFGGNEGRLLDGMLAAIGCRRDAGSVPGEPLRDRAIGRFAPKAIFALGEAAAAQLLGGAADLASLRGRLHRHRDIPVVVSYHPTDLLRTPPDKARAWEDLVLLRRTLSAHSTKPS